ncbi:cytochrome c oxidase accessory protein CcoG [Hugenholtzia roseola]|uniref:cytochrome c oxidase accessory protein CcoG n=1 Tax=Hugenholtzia roseola TaxID=1002 RepID=UPI00040FDB17|nr:cytochrome c oxidase accessory protein CcoG [Hugenholtzia roseola]
MATQAHSDEDFRDVIATVDKDGKRKWIYPKKPSGRYHNGRIIVSILLLAFLIAIPFIKIKGHQALLFDVLDRKFVIFGQIFMPQDFHLFVLGMLLSIVFVIVFTLAYGRIFCGWVCPQTIFMEMVFRKIEYWIEGDANQQRRLNQAPWTGEKIAKKTAKHLIFLLIAFGISNLFLAYIVSTERLGDMIADTPKEHMGIFTALLFFTGAFYGVFAFLREQVCTTICPYGRLQGVLLTKESIVISYDYVRGEPRGKYKKPKKELQSDIEVLEQKIQGDCVDCGLCVQVCPTGIDIRNGTQLECVNCTACIDACDDIMDRFKRPRGLIRYASEKEIAEDKKFAFTPRLLFYSAVLVVLAAVMGGLLFTRQAVEVTILRAQGQTFQRLENGHIRNMYMVQAINKTSEPAELRFVLETPQKGKIEVVGQAFSLEAEGLKKGVLVVDLPFETTAGRKTPVSVAIYAGEQLLEIQDLSFFAPKK